MSTRSLLAPVLGLALVACAKRGDHPLAPSLPEHAAAVHQRIVLAGVPLTLETFLARDFMPPAPPEGLPLTARFLIATADGSPLPPGLGLMSASVLYQGQSWMSVPVVTASSNPSVMEAVSSGGPMWGPDVTVDVVVTLSLGEHVRELLGARDQLIQRTE